MVDDDRLIRQLAVEILEWCGDKTRQAADGEEGVDGFLQKPFSSFELSRQVHDILQLES